MKVFVGSPFRSSTDDGEFAHVQYAQDMCRELAMLGHEPFAPHLFAPSFLMDADSAERSAGMRISKAWLGCADCAVFCGDFGISAGMREEMAACVENHVPFVTTSTEWLEHDFEVLCRVAAGAVVTENERKRCKPWQR